MGVCVRPLSSAVFSSVDLGFIYKIVLEVEFNRSCDRMDTPAETGKAGRKCNVVVMGEEQYV